jgi:hypothetical protein
MGIEKPAVFGSFCKIIDRRIQYRSFKANNEIQTVNARILEKLAKLLTPSIYTHPIPAHAVAFTQPYSSEVLLEHTEFFFRKQMTSTVKSESDKQLNIPLHP